MKYILKCGALYDPQSQQALAKIKCSLPGPVKKIFRGGDEPALRTDIRYSGDPNRQGGDVRNKEYTITDPENQIVAAAHPDYAEGEDPSANGWPVCRLPRVDHARLTIKGAGYFLRMYGSGNYIIREVNSQKAVRIVHRGTGGGWSVEDSVGLTPEMLCGLFVFCRYLEQENELVLV